MASKTTWRVEKELTLAGRERYSYRILLKICAVFKGCHRASPCEVIGMTCVQCIGQLLSLIWEQPTDAGLRQGPNVRMSFRRRKLACSMQNSPWSFAVCEVTGTKCVHRFGSLASKSGKPAQPDSEKRSRGPVSNLAVHGLSRLRRLACDRGVRANSIFQRGPKVQNRDPIIRVVEGEPERVLDAKPQFFLDRRRIAKITNARLNRWRRAST